MGRSRGKFIAADEDPIQRTRNKKNDPSGENSEFASAGEGETQGKGALYHCNYCNKDITGKIRIKCSDCPDFDLCVECFSVGAELTPHKSDHPYRVMDRLSFSLFCSEWVAEEEMLLLEGIVMYGLCNWAEVAEHVGTKSKAQCVDHYTSVYLNSPCFPLPDLSRIDGKTREEILAMDNNNKDNAASSTSMLEKVSLKEKSAFTPTSMDEDSHNAAEVDSEISHGGSNMSATTSVKRKTSNISQVKNSEDTEIGGNVGERKPIATEIEGPLVEFSGYNSKRHEFEIEYDNNAEKLLADMEFIDTDPPSVRELKLRVIASFNRRLEERNRRKDFIKERDLLNPNRFKDYTPEEIALCEQYDQYMSLYPKEKFEELLETIIAEHRTKKELDLLKKAHAAGCRTHAQLAIYKEVKRKIEEEEDKVGRAKNKGASSSSTAQQQQQQPTGINFRNTAVFAEDFLSQSEKRLCTTMKISAGKFLEIQEVMAREILAGKVAKKSDARRLFDYKRHIIDAIYDVLVMKGIAKR